ncbi:hypothetical protein HM1_0401 [Heliomicrobium modesticaldum Ice1]|uniref:Uncharacterized protein n=1 Tax=Heliobacterium modesticaldum (strain ATCC 51547 / Ice1) TaxID=498761 RepID=B0TF35_HELMI|nr:hypothetical protein HM1_0401 [Heliomicrobium modesticaldum Ice1]
MMIPSLVARQGTGFFILSCYCFNGVCFNLFRCNLSLILIKINSAKEVENKMLGLHDPWIAGAYLLCIASTLLCVGYAYWGQHQGE